MSPELKSSGAASSPVIHQELGKMERLRKNIYRDKYLLIIILPVIAYYLIFHYLPMYGILIAFKKFYPLKGILGSPWVGFTYFEQFFSSIYFWRILKNTLLLSFYSLVWGFPVPIIFALLLNELKDNWFKKTVQTVSYLPHFISIVVISGMIIIFTSPIDGIINYMLGIFGIDPIHFLNESGYFRTIFISSGVWQEFGWGTIIYLAAIAGIDPQLYEAAQMDGANRWHKMKHITLPCLLPTIVILLILNLGSLMNVGFEKIILLYNPTTYETADVISSYVYRRGILEGEYSLSAAIGLFNNVINLVLLVSVNYISRKISDTSLW
ncbi:ABC transporter permease [Paenibacillus eucommiae]|uniref:Aldouronate transport system permease protein n=1 Tax=Paenibacillus eucommiae TaxID=1355755 RepID=A0ABS4IVQ6_9BACL|nr:ABC transporter permease subunit [Paenibacillus eucommiae]MBP1991673.1 putative aldouronate transport system permease protein [Paenibacillus eucommiae]